MTLYFISAPWKSLFIYFDIFFGYISLIIYNLEIYKIIIYKLIIYIMYIYFYKLLYTIVVYFIYKIIT